MPTRINVARISKLMYGCNTSPDVMAPDRYQAQFIKNMHLSEDGIAFTRGGSRLLNETALDGAVTGIYEFRRPDGASYASTLLVKAGTYLYSVDTDTGVATAISDLNVSTRPTFCTFQDGSSISYVFIADGTNFLKWDGTTLTNADAGEDYPWTSGNAPRYIWVYDDRMLAAGMDDEPYRVFVSAALDGTDWKPSDTSSAVYWTLKSPSGDRITGLHSVYDFGVIFQQYGTTIITEANADSDTSKQIKVSSNYGTSSHWSVQTVGNELYFADAVHIYRGKLRQAVENGLEVMPIDNNVLDKFSEAQNADDIVSCYDARRKEIQWGIRSKHAANSNIALVFNVGRSGPAGDMGQRDVWSGWFEGDGYEPYTLAPVQYTESKLRVDGTSYTYEAPLVFRGDSNGHVYIMDEDNQYKDERRVSGTTTEHDIESKIVTAAHAPRGMVVSKRLRDVVISLYQYHDASTTIQCIIDDRRILPSTARTINYRNVVPYWNDGTDSDEKQEWNNTIWSEHPTMAKPIAMNIPFQFIQFIITNDGSNDTDRISYGGGEFTYQAFGVRRNV